MIIIIMTRGRVGKQETLKHLPKKWKDRTVLLCPPGEEHDHHSISCVARNYSEKFQWIYQGKYFGFNDKVVIMDDDLWFNQYRDGRLCTVKDPEENEPLFDLMEAMLDEIPLVGVHPRMMAQNAKPPFEWNGKIVTVQGLNRRLLPKGLKLDHDPILADVWLNCEVLSRGLPNARITTHFVDWLPSQAAGGCDYRTAEMQQIATKRIADAFPNHATQVVKTPKTAKWLGESRYDLRVSWKRLYNDAPKSHLLDDGKGEHQAAEGDGSSETVE